MEEKFLKTALLFIGSLVVYAVNRPYGGSGIDTAFDKSEWLWDHATEKVERGTKEGQEV